MTVPQATAAAVSSATTAQASQAGLVLLFARELEQSWPNVDPQQLKATLPRFTAIIAQLVHRYGAASSTLAARFYQSQRQAAGIAGRFTVKPADPPPWTQIRSTVGWATRDMWVADPPVDQALKDLTGATEQLVLDQGRDTIIGAANTDRKAIGWARVPEPDACYFCAMLATRGAVYKEDTVGFKAHNNCRCHVEPVFTHYEPSAQIREWDALYAKATKGSYGGTNVLNAFRQAYEGR